LGDSGYQGLQHDHEQIWLPIKKLPKRKLTKDQRIYNKALSSLRVLVENIICKLKVFQILSQRFRNRRKKYAVVMKNIAGILNLVRGF